MMLIRSKGYGKIPAVEIFCDRCLNVRKVNRADRTDSLFLWDIYNIFI